MTVAAPGCPACGSMAHDVDEDHLPPAYLARFHPDSDVGPCDDACVICGRFPVGSRPCQCNYRAV